MTEQVEDATKKCPYCAETIKAEAIVCRFCGRDLSGKAPQTVVVQQLNTPTKSGNVVFVLPAIILIVIACPFLMLIQQPILGIIAGTVGAAILIFAIMTGRLKFLG